MVIAVWVWLTKLITNTTSVPWSQSQLEDMDKKKCEGQDLEKKEMKINLDSSPGTIGSGELDGGFEADRSGLRCHESSIHFDQLSWQLSPESIGSPASDESEDKEDNSVSISRPDSPDIVPDAIHDLVESLEKDLFFPTQDSEEGDRVVDRIAQQVDGPLTEISVDDLDDILKSLDISDRNPNSGSSSVITSNGLPFIAKTADNSSCRSKRKMPGDE